MKTAILILSLASFLLSQQLQEYVLDAQQRIIKSGTERYLPNTSIWVFEGDLIIEKGATLIIEAGTTLRFVPNTDKTRTGKDKNRSEVIVLGELIAEGEASTNKFITFTSAATAGAERSGDWYGIYIYKSKHSTNNRIKNCNISYAYRGITCVGSSPYIRNNRFLYNQNTGIYLTSRSEAVIESNVIQNNGYAGIEIRNLSRPKIYYNNITENEYGIMVYDSSNPNLGFVRANNRRVSRKDKQYLVGENTIINNFEYDFYNASSKDIYAQNNSWSSSRSKDIQAKIFDRSDQSSYGRVVFEPITAISSAELLKKNLEEQSVQLASVTKKKSKRKSKKSRRSRVKPKAVKESNTKRTKPKNTESIVASKKETTVKSDTKKEEKKITVPIEEKRESFTQISQSRPYITLALDPGTGKKLNNPRPVYTSQIQSQNIKGRVVILVTVGLDGNVESAKILKAPHVMLEQPALEAAKRFKYSKGKVQGQVVRFEKTEFFRF